MIILANTTDTLKVVLLSGITFNNAPCYASFRDTESGTTLVPGRAVSTTNGTTPVTLVDAPSASVQRGIDNVMIVNTDTASMTVVFSYDANGTGFEIARATLAPGERFAYANGSWVAYANSGAIKQSLNQGTAAVESELNLQVLDSDVVNNNPVANSLQDLTGLSVPVVSGNTYYFKFSIKYLSQATNNGSRWTLDGPAFSDLTARSVYSLAATTQTLNTVNAYAFPTASNTTSANLNGNFAILEGWITPSADGNLIVRFASELANQAITAKAGSFVEYRQIS